MKTEEILLIAEHVNLIGPGSRTHDLHDAIERFYRIATEMAVSEEREACAKVCEYQADRFMQASPLEGNRPYASHECAAAIRARSNT